MKIILLGPPGSGKGTQIKLIEKKIKIKTISIGDILRNEINNNTKLGNEIKYIQQNGDLISDNIVFSLINNIIKYEENIIFDGFPRTLTQTNFIIEKNIKIDLLINIKINKNFILKRIKYRMINIKSCKSYNIIYNKPKIKNKDDITGENLTLRLDDNYKTIIKRLTTYDNIHKNIIYFFKKNSNIKQITIDGSNKIENIFNQIIKNII